MIISHHAASRRGAIRLTCFALAATLGLTPALTAQSPEKPFFDGRNSVHAYNGPGRDEPGPEGLAAVRFGYFGPSDSSHPLHGDSWTAAVMAAEDLNAEGGYHGLPFRLLPAWSENPWGSGVSQVAKMVYGDGIIALIGGVDGPTAHLAEQIVAKARLPLLNPGSSDRTANMAHVPWVFSFLPGEDLQMEALVAVLESEGRTARPILISATDHDSRAITAEFLKALEKRGEAPLLHLNVTAGDEAELSGLDRGLLNGSSGHAPAGTTLVVLADPAVSARVAHLLSPDYSGPVFGSSAMARTLFQTGVSGLPNRYVYPLPADPGSMGPFSNRFRLRTGHSADFAAASTYDAVRLLGQSVRQAGANRARVGDALREASGWTGAAGTVTWDRTGQNTRRVVVCELEKGTMRPAR